MKNHDRLASAHRPLGTVGLLLLGLVGRLAEHAYPSGRADHGTVQALFARRAIDGIAAIGWTVDRLGGRMRPSARAVKRGLIPARYSTRPGA